MLATILQFLAAILIVSAIALALTANNALFRWPRLLALKASQHRRYRRRKKLSKKNAEIFEIDDQQDSEWRSGQH